VSVLPWGRRDDLTPALVAALALHLGVFAAIVLLRQPASILPSGSAVAIEIVSKAPASYFPPAEAPQPATLTDVQAAPRRRDEPSPLQRDPETAAPAASVVAASAPARPVPTAKPARSDRAFSLDALAASVAKTAQSATGRSTQQRQSPPRSQTPLQARSEASQSVSASDLQGLQQLLERLWNPNCSVEGADSVVVPVKFTVGPSGRVIGRVAAGEGSSADPVVFAAARRAIDAVHEAEPYGSDYRDQSFTVNFDAAKACSQH